MAPASLRFVSKSFKTKFIGQGKVSFLKSKQPEVKEIEAAKYLASKTGAKIYIRGGKNEKGPDFFFDGKLWELKTLMSGPSNAVANNMKKSLRDGNQGTRFIIDGRDAGLTEANFRSGISNAIRDNKIPSQVKGILGNGDIIEWP